MKKIYQLSLVCFLMLAASCGKDDPVEIVPEEPKPLAKFSIEQSAPDDAFTFDFKNTSENVKNIRWTFGDDSISTEMTPKHTYLNPGTYTVLLTVGNDQGYIARQELEVKIDADKLLNFTATPESNGTVKLNLSSQTAFSTFLWTFENNSTSTESSPVTNVPSGSIRKVMLKATTAKGSTATINRLVTDFGVAQDVTIGASLLVSKDNNSGATSGEGSLKLIDNSIDSKFLVSSFTSLWAVQTLTLPHVVKLYSITSGNDASERDPKEWTLEGSEDGVSWELLDTRNETFGSRKQTRIFAISNTKSFIYYRWTVTKNVNSSLMQVGEWRLMSVN